MSMTRTGGAIHRNPFPPPGPRPYGIIEQHLNGRTIAAFALGCCGSIPLQFVGVVFLGELLFVFLAVWVILTRIQTAFWSSTATRCTVMLLMALAGYVISDIFRGTPSEDYLRGWSKMTFIVTSFISLYYLTRRNGAALAGFLAGCWLSHGVVAYIQYIRNANESFEFMWKFTFALPLTLVPLCLLTRWGARGTRPSAYFLAFMGVLHVVLDYRSLGLTCFLVSAILLAATRTRKGKLKVNQKALVLTAVFGGVALLWLYFSNQTQYGVRRDASNAWRLATTVALTKGIARSPIIGSGSWSSDPEMEAWRDEAMESRGTNRYAAGKSDRFMGHSEILQAWYEGGILTVAFFVYYGYQLVAVTWILIRRRLDHFSALFLFWTLYVAWGLLFNPLNGFIRLDIASALALICFVREEQRILQRQAAQSRPRPVYSTRNYRPLPASPLGLANQ